MAKPRVEKTLDEILGSLNDRIRALELKGNTIKNWSLVEDASTGQLLAVRDNGQDVAKTIVVLA